jgi:lysophospholipase L1-like esterase
MWWDEPPSKPGEIAGQGPYRQGVWRLAIAFTVLAVLAAATYLVPGMEAYRPWEPGEPIPLSRLTRFQRAGGEAASVGTSEAGGVPMTPEQARESAAASLGADLAANLGPEATAGGEGDEPVDVAETHQGVTIAPDELQGLVRTIEDPSGRALDAFFAALARTAGGQDGHVTRIAHWGDSTIAADDVTATLRRRFQKRFGDAGHGFQLIGKGTMPYRHKDVVSEQSGNWTVNSVIRKELDDGRYGYGGHLHRSRGGDGARYETVKKGPIGLAVARFELFYQRHPGGGRVELVVDDRPPRTIDTREATVADAWETIEVPDGPHALSLRTLPGGESRLYGIAMERPGPGVVYDSLGIVGARASRMLNFDPDHLAGQIAHRAPDLLIIAFGGNEAGDKGMNFERYRKVLTDVVRRVRAGRPEASCLLLAPLDQGDKDRRGKVRTMPNVPQIVAAQREVAAAEGCAFFDTFQAMGGEGAMYRWYQAKPRLGWGDFRHATPAGYEVVGNLFYKALLKGFSDWLDRAREPAPASPAGQ